MQTKEERETGGAPVSASEGEKVILSSDPREVVVEMPDGTLVDWESRRGFGQQAQKLSYPERKGFHRHWFNDEPGRVETARRAGYTPVVEADGQVVSRVVDKTTGMRAYLHEIPEVWYKADLAAGQKAADEKDVAIRAGRAVSPTGEAAEISEKNFYGKISLSRKTKG